MERPNEAAAKVHNSNIPGREMAETKKIPQRSKVRTADTWDLSSLFPSGNYWEKTLRKYEKEISGYEKFRGALARDARTLAAALSFDCHMDRLGERIGVYAFLKAAEDQTNSQHQGMVAQYENVATQVRHRGQAPGHARLPQPASVPLRQAAVSRHVRTDPVALQPREH